MARSIKHDTLGQMGLTWLKCRCGSFRGAPEIRISNGFVVDAACLCVMYHGEFARRCSEWGLAPKTFTYSVSESNWMSRDEKGDIPDYFGCVFEAKATRADFLSTFGGRDNSHGNRMNPVANLHWIVAEPEVCKPEEVPAHWGLLIRRGRGLSEKKPPKYIRMEEVDLLRMSDRILWKGHWWTNICLPSCPNCDGQVQYERASQARNENIPNHLHGTPPLAEPPTCVPA